MPIGRAKNASFHKLVMKQRQKKAMRGATGRGDGGFGDGLAAAALSIIADGRDVQSALDALSDVRKTDLPFSATSIETIRTRLTEKRDAAESRAFTKSMRDRLARYFDYATLSLERWPLEAIDFDT